MRRYGWLVLAVAIIAALLAVIAVQHQALQAARAAQDHREAAFARGLPAPGTAGPPAEFIPLGGRP